jgi:hypothetical protein
VWHSVRRVLRAQKYSFRFDAPRDEHTRFCFCTLVLCPLTLWIVAQGGFSCFWGCTDINNVTDHDYRWAAPRRMPVGCA